MYRGCESAIGLLINLKVIEDKNKDEDQKLAYVEDSEFWLKKTFSSVLGCRAGYNSPQSSWSSCWTHCCCCGCCCLTPSRYCGVCCVVALCCTGCCWVAVLCCTGLHCCCVVAQCCCVVALGEVDEVLDCLEHFHDHQPWDVIVIRNNVEEILSSDILSKIFSPWPTINGITIRFILINVSIIVIHRSFGERRKMQKGMEGCTNSMKWIWYRNIRKPDINWWKH